MSETFEIEKSLKDDIKNNENEKENDIKYFYRCQKCYEIPFIRINKEKNTITTECNNGHILENIPLEEFISNLQKDNHSNNNSEIKKEEKNKFNDSLCNIHNEKYINYCNTCKKNLCMYCDYNMHESHDIKIFFPLISNLESNIKETKLKYDILNEFIDIMEKWRKQLNEKILAFETFLKNNIFLFKLNTMNFNLKNINYQILKNYYEFSDYKSDNIIFFKKFNSAKNFTRKGKILLNILNLYENNNNKKKEEKRDLINNIEVKSTMNQSAYSFNHFVLKNDNYTNHLIGLISDENIKIYSIAKNNLDFEIVEKLIINESKNINYLSQFEIKDYKNLSSIIICVDNIFKIIKILIENNNIIGYEEKKIFTLNDIVKKVILNLNKIIACDKNTISIFQNDLDLGNTKLKNEDDLFNFKKINDIKAEEANNIYDIININEKEFASIQKNKKNDNKILVYFYSIEDYKIIKNIEININNNLKDNENGIISSYSSLMINKDMLGIIYINSLFLISIANKELISTTLFDGELYFIEKYINDTFILNRKMENNDINKENTNQDKDKRTSILYQYKIGNKNEIIELGHNDEMINLSEFKYFSDYELGISTSYDNNIVSIWN